MNNNIRPAHYEADDNNPYEVIKIIQHYNLSFEIGNCLKYSIRAGKKDPDKHVEDLEKAIQYLQFEIDKIKKDSWKNLKVTK